MRTVLGAAVLAVVLSGCSPAQPTLAGGKPVEHWLRALQDAQPQARKQAVLKLGNVGSEDPAVLPALLAALRDRDAEVRCAAVLALVKLGPAARDAVPQLDEAQRHDPDDQVRACAARAVEKMRSME